MGAFGPHPHECAPGAQHVPGEILRARGLGRLQHLIRPQHLPGDAGQKTGELTIVDDSGIAAEVAIAVIPAHLLHDGHHLLQLLLQLIPDGGIEAAHRARQRHPVADDVFAHAAVDFTEGDHAFLHRGNAPGDQGLGGHDHLSGQHDGVGAQVGVSAMRFLAQDVDDDAIGRGHHRARAHAHRAHRQGGIHVDADDGVHIVHHALLHHQLGAAVPIAADDLFCRLEDELDPARDLILHLLEQHGRAQKHGGVRIMPAGVHHARSPGFVGNVVLLIDGQRVHIRAQGDGGAVAPAQIADHAGAGRLGLMGDAQIVQGLGHERAGLIFLKGKLGPLVQMTTDAFEFGKEGLGVGEHGKEVGFRIADCGFGICLAAAPDCLRRAYAWKSLALASMMGRFCLAKRV